MFKFGIFMFIASIAFFVGGTIYQTNLVNDYNHQSLDVQVKTGLFCHGDSVKTLQDKIDCYILAHSK